MSGSEVSVRTMMDDVYFWIERSSEQAFGHLVCQLFTCTSFAHRIGLSGWICSLLDGYTQEV